jgi:hypothetical protein
MRKVMPVVTKINPIGYNVGDMVRVVDGSIYSGLEGTIARMGMAYPYPMLHVVFAGKYGNNPMTLYERQVMKINALSILYDTQVDNQPEILFDTELGSDVVTPVTEVIDDVTFVKVAPPVVTKVKRHRRTKAEMTAAKGITPVVEAPVRVPGKRGRPKGSKNKSK